MRASFYSTVIQRIVGAGRFTLAATALLVGYAAHGQTTVAGPLTYPNGVTTVPSSGSASTITTSGSVAVGSGARVTYSATSAISLEPGFSTLSGGTFHAQIVSATVPSITSPTTATGQVGVSFTYNITTSVSVTSYAAPGLPAGLSLNTATGVISGTPTTVGTSTVTVSATNASGAGSLSVTFTINPSIPVITSSTTAAAQVGSTFNYTITASGPPASFSASGLPAGLTLNATSGLIYGTPTTTGSTGVTIGAINTAGTGTAILTITTNAAPQPPVITSSSNVSATVNTGFSYQITALNQPTSFGATGLPSWLSMDASGRVSGTPTATGTYSMTVSASNSGGVGSLGVTITVNGNSGPVISRQPTDQAPAIRAVAAGTTHSVAVRQDGAIWAWGGNSNGQLGDGTTTGRTAPVNSLATGTYIGVATMGTHTVAVNANGTVIAFGSNSSGQLGDGTTTDRAMPVTIPGISGVVAVAAGSAHTLLLKADGTVWACGLNNHGQLGDGSVTNRSTPVQVSDITQIVAIACGYSHSIALGADGSVWVWGYDAYGALGDGGAADRATPLNIPGWSGAVAIAGGFAHTLVAKSDGSVWTAGYNNYGQLGNGNTTNSSVPVQAMPGGSGIVAVAAGQYHSLLLKSDGTVFSAGYNNYGQLGDGTTTNRSNFAAISAVTGVAAMSGGAAHTIALKNEGTVAAWGYNVDGELGNGTTTSQTAPVSPTSLNTAVFNVVAQGSAGMTYQWQYKAVGQSTFTGISNGGNYSGATSANLQVSGGATLNGTQYRCLVTDGGSTTISTVGTLSTGVPTVVLVDGDNQTTIAGQFNAKPFVAAVWNSAGTQPLVDAPVTYTVQFGGGLLSTINSSAGTISQVAIVRTDSTGSADIYYQQPSTSGITSVITATTAGGTSLTFHSTSASTQVDSDHNGLPDNWEMAHFGHIGVDPNADPDGDGLTNLQEFLLGTDPNNPTDGRIVASYQVILSTPAGQYMGIQSNWTIAPVNGP